jgi:hypothetical protein
MLKSVIVVNLVVIPNQHGLHMFCRVAFCPYQAFLHFKAQPNCNTMKDVSNLDFGYTIGWDAK